MMDALFELTALPNLHPALVHFPIALAAVALLFEVAVLIRWRSASADCSAAALWALAAAGAGAAYMAGRAAADGAGALSAAAEATLTSHADAALATLLALGLLALLRVWLAWRDAAEARPRRDALRIVVLMGAFIAQGLVAYTGDLGGALVYRHGVAVLGRSAQAVAPASVTSSQDEPATGTGISYLEDGSLVWAPRPGDPTVLGRVLEPFGSATVRVAAATASEEGLSLVVSGQTLLWLPGSWEDVQLEMRVDASGFKGSFAVGARMEGDSSGGFFRIRSDGGTELVARREGKEDSLDEAETPLPRSEMTIGLSAVGRHWKGFVDRQTVVHGHAQLASVGRVALLLDGTGTIRLISVRISPVTKEKAPATTEEKTPATAHEERGHEH
jgi:uncharacterized membrane protein